MTTTPSPHKWRTLWLLSLAEMLGMAVWFSASAVVPALTEAWNLSDGGRAWLTMSVQIGFVAGALASAVLNLADRIPARWFFTAASLLAGLATALIPAVADGLAAALLLRFLTGMFLAGWAIGGWCCIWRRGWRWRAVSSPGSLCRKGHIERKRRRLTGNTSARLCGSGKWRWRIWGIWGTCGSCTLCGPGFRRFCWRVLSGRGGDEQ